MKEQFKRLLIKRYIKNYDREGSTLPDCLTVEFEDGTIEKYYRHIDQPAPMLAESMRIIRKWADEGYHWRRSN